MGKMSELALLVDEYMEANRKAQELAEEIKAVINGVEAPACEEKAPVKPVTLEEVRAVLATKSREGHSEEIRELLKKYGADRLSAIAQECYAKLMKEAEELSDAT